MGLLRIRRSSLPLSENGGASSRNLLHVQRDFRRPSLVRILGALYPEILAEGRSFRWAFNLFVFQRLFSIPLDLLGGPVVSFLYYYGYSNAQEILHQNWKWLALYAVGV